jgi:hypothetical protein
MDERLIVGTIAFACFTGGIALGWWLGLETWL